MSILPIAAVGAADALAQAPPAAAARMQGGFASMLAEGVESVDAKVKHADQVARAFAVDDSVPVHEVTFALEQAKLSLELMMQVRSRLVEGYQELLRMQL